VTAVAVAITPASTDAETAPKFLGALEVTVALPNAGAPDLKTGLMVGSVGEANVAAQLLAVSSSACFFARACRSDHVSFFVLEAEVGEDCCKAFCSITANGFFNFLGGGRLTGVHALLFGSILSSSAGFVGVLAAATGEGLGEIVGLREENAGEGEAEGLLAVMALKTGRLPEGTAGGREEAGGGGGAAGTGFAFSSGHAFAGPELAAFPYSDPAEAVGAPNVGLNVETGGLEAGGGAFFKAAISTFPTGV
jgi:hypothetical protein